MPENHKSTSSLVVFFTGGLITLAATLYHANLNQEILLSDFERDAKRIGIEIEDISSNHVAELHSLKALLMSNLQDRPIDEVARAFSRYLLERNVEDDFVGLYGIGLVERVPVGRESAFIDAMSDYYNAPFTIQTLRSRPAENADRWVVATTYPARNDSALGVDLTSENKRYAAVIQTLATGQRQTTGYISLVTVDDVNEYGYLMLQPVIGRDGSIERMVYAVTTFRYTLEKLASYMFRSQEFLPLHINVFDRAGRYCLAHFRTDLGMQNCDIEDRFVDDASDLQYSFSIDKEMYVIRPTQKYLSTAQNHSHWITALLGALLSLIVGFYARRLRHEKVLLGERVKQRTAELQQSLEEAQVAEKVKQEFLQKVSHELRTPLNGIMGVLQILERDLRSNEHLQLVKLAESSSFHLLGLVEDILDTAKINQGTFSLSNIVFELKPHLMHVIDMLEASARSKKLTLALDLAGNLPEWVIGDERRIRQVLINLLGNAIKFTDVGEVTLRVFVTQQMAEQVELRFRVEDTGIGIPLSKQKEIFDEFRQVENDLTRSHEGAGLGLSITRSILQAMGSHIDVYSDLGVGSCFQFDLSLPIGSRPQHDIDREVRHRPIAPQLDGRRIAVVDDVSVNLMITKSMLESQGAEVVCYVNAMEALRDIIKTANFDAVITDIQMPGMSGLEMVQRLREMGLVQLPIIGLSGQCSEEDRLAAMDAGMSDYLLKPVDMDMLVNAINKGA